MSKHLQGEKPGWHVVNAAGAPVSGPWNAKADGLRAAVAKGAAYVAVLWNGSAVVVA